MQEKLEKSVSHLFQSEEVDINQENCWQYKSDNYVRQCQSQQVESLIAVQLR